MEHSSGMEEFPEEDFREHRVLPAVPDSIDLWGGSSDSRLGAIGHIENPHLHIAISAKFGADTVGFLMDGPHDRSA
jgi:hypothetical protein